MKSLENLIAFLSLVLFATVAFATTDAEVFAFAAENYSSIFTGTPTAGQTTYQGKQYNYQYYPASGNYLAVDTVGMIYILGPYTNNALTPVAAVTSFTPVITAWEATAIPYTIMAHEVSGSCALSADRVINGILTPTSQSNFYTTVFAGAAMIRLNVPGSSTLSFSFPDGGGTTTENMQLTFDSQSRVVTGTSNWTNSNGLNCMGSMIFSGTLGSVGIGPYLVPVSVVGSTSNTTNVQVCVTASGNETCGLSGGFAVGQSGTISVMAASGASYIIHVPTNQPAASFCSVTSGGSGVLSSILATAVVTCQ